MFVFGRRRRGVGRGSDIREGFRFSEWELKDRRFFYYCYSGMFVRFSFLAIFYI